MRVRAAKESRAAILKESEIFGARVVDSSVEGFALEVTGETADGTLWCWGYGRDFQTGTGSSVALHAPTQVGEDSDWLRVSSGSIQTSHLTLK